MDHKVLPATHTSEYTLSYPQPKVGTQFTYQEGMEGWVDIGDWFYIRRWFTRTQTVTSELGQIPDQLNVVQLAFSAEPRLCNANYYWTKIKVKLELIISLPATGPHSHTVTTVYSLDITDTPYFVIMMMITMNAISLSIHWSLPKQPLEINQHIKENDLSHCS